MASLAAKRHRALHWQVQPHLRTFGAAEKLSDAAIVGQVFGETLQGTLSSTWRSHARPPPDGTTRNLVSSMVHAPPIWPNCFDASFSPTYPNPTVATLHWPRSLLQDVLSESEPRSVRVRIEDFFFYHQKLGDIKNP